MAPGHSDMQDAAGDEEEDGMGEWRNGQEGRD